MPCNVLLGSIKEIPDLMNKHAFSANHLEMHTVVVSDHHDFFKCGIELFGDRIYFELEEHSD